MINYLFAKELHSMSSAGRPPKLTPEIHVLIVDDIAHAIPYEYAAEANGICEATLYNWLEQGRKDRANGLESIYTRLLEDIKKAERNRIKRHSDNLDAHVKDWAADSWMLERRWWKHYSKSVPLLDMERSLHEMAKKMEKDDGKAYRDLKE